MIVKVKLRNGHALEVNCKPEELSQKNLERMFLARYWCIDNFIIRTDEILYLKKESDGVCYKKKEDHNDGC